VTLLRALFYLPIMLIAAPFIVVLVVLGSIKRS